MQKLIAVAIIIICLIIFYFWVFKTSRMQDEKTGRIYKYVKDTGSPHHATCKNCGERARLIYTFVGKKYLAKKLYGTDCMFCHYTIWFDLREKKEDL